MYTKYFKDKCSAMGSVQSKVVNYTSPVDRNLQVIEELCHNAPPRCNTMSKKKMMRLTRLEKVLLEEE